jgi:hypothetical protein
MMEAARTSETSVDIELRTRQYIPEDSKLHNGLSLNFVDRISALNQRPGGSESALIPAGNSAGQTVHRWVKGGNRYIAWSQQAVFN